MKKISIIVLLFLVIIPSMSMAFNQDSLLKIYYSDKFSTEKRYNAIQKVTYYFFNKNADSSLKYTYKLAKFCKINGMEPEYNKTLANLGYSLISFGRYQEARNLLSIAKNYFLKQKDIARASYCESQLATIYLNMEMIIEAYKGYKKAQSYYDETFIRKVINSDKKYYESQNDSMKRIINIYMNISTDYGLFLYRLGDYDNAKIEFKKIERLAKITGELNRLCGTYVNQAIVDIAKDDRADGIVKLKKALEITKKTQNIAFQVIASNTLANNYLTKKNLMLAKQLTDETVKISKNGMFPYELCTSLVLNSDVYLELKKYDVVFKNASEALSIANEMKYTSRQLELYLLLSKYFINTGNKDSAVYYLDIRDSLDEAIKEDNNNYKKDLLRLTTDLEKKENEEKDAKSKEVLSLRTIWLLSVLLLFAIVGLILLLFALRMRNKRNHTLKEMNVMKNRFFSIVAHDIMSPVAMNKQTWDLFNSSYNELDKDSLDILIRENTQSSARLYELTNNLLMWARTMMKEIHINKEELNINQLFEKQLSLMQVNMIEKNISLRNELDKNLLVKCDQNIISFVVRNLLANAIKFTNNGGEIVISNTIIKDKFLINITDNGIGMDDKIKNQLFKILEGKISEGTNQEKGSGLGLVLCKEFLDLHKSKIYVESELNKGTTISFELDVVKNNED
ncbi:MAG: HAMP domain-containing sensor histidine kinase [bacterium]